MPHWVDKRKVEGIRVPGEGPLPASIMLVGERPGKNEPLAGRPFVGMAGRELDRYLRLAGIQREDVYISNIVKDYLDADPEPWEVARDTPDLEEELAACQPKLVVPLGRFA